MCSNFDWSRLHLLKPTSLQAILSQPQKPANLTELESQALHAAHEGQRIHVVLAVSWESTFRPWRSWQQAVTLVETDRWFAAGGRIFVSR